MIGIVIGMYDEYVHVCMIGVLVNVMVIGRDGFILLLQQNQASKQNPNPSRHS